MVTVCPEDEVFGNGREEVEKVWQRQDDCFRQIRQIEAKMERCDGDVYQQRKLAFHLRRLQNVALPRINEEISRLSII